MMQEMIMAKNDVLSLEGFTRQKIEGLIGVAQNIKKDPKAYSWELEGQTLLSIFEKPSLRTRISFELAMKQLGGHTITIDSQSTPMGKKESIEDTAKVASRYADIIMARMYSHEDLLALARNASVPVINGLTDKFHPCQILSDLLTIKEKKETLEGLTLAYFGDANNNVTHCLMVGCAIMGVGIRVACPKGYMPAPDVLGNALALAGGSEVAVGQDPAKAAKGADIVYTDSWMSYHIPEGQKMARMKDLMPFQVTEGIMKLANKDAIFMNCLPAQRGMEQSADVIDGPQSIVFDQAENRLHMQKAILLHSKGLIA